jgi:hypothetical protein
MHILRFAAQFRGYRVYRSGSVAPDRVGNPPQFITGNHPGYKQSNGTENVHDR